MAILTFLHVSDLHYDQENEFDRKIVIDALLQDVRKARDDGVQFDAVIFSGDLVKAGTSGGGFDRVTAVFIDPLVEAAGLSRDRFVLCPGNHDINREEIVPFLEEGLLSNLKGIPQINAFIDKALAKPAMDDAIKAALSRMNPYEEFYKTLNLPFHKTQQCVFQDSNC